MAAVGTVLYQLLVVTVLVDGGIAALAFRRMRQLGPGGVPPVLPDTQTVRDFQTLLAAEALFLFGATLFAAGGYYGMELLLDVSQVSGILAALLFGVVLARWTRRLP